MTANRKSQNVKSKIKQPRQAAWPPAFLQGPDILENISDGFLFLDRQMTFRYANRRAAELLGRQAGNLIGKCMWEEFPEAKGTPLGDACLRALETSTFTTFEALFEPWGRWFENRIHPTEEGLSIFFTDITERKQKDAALQESEERFRRVVMDAPFPIYIHAEDGETILINDAWLRQSGYRREEILTIEAWMNKAYGRRTQFVRTEIKPLYSLAAAVDEGEDTICTASGELRIWHFHTAPLGRLPDGRQHVISMAVDITDHRRAEDALRESQEHLQTVLTSAPIVFYAVDREGTFTLSEGAGLQRTGLRPGQLVGASSFDLYGSLPVILPDGSTIQGQELLDRALAGETLTGTFEVDGVYFENRFAPLRKRNKQVDGLVGVSIDVTEQKRAEERITFQARLLDAVGSAVVAIDLQDRILYWNRAAEELYGWKAEEVLGRKSLEIIPAMQSREEGMRILAELFQGKSWSGEFLVRKKDGTVFPIFVTDTPIPDKSGNLMGIIGVSTDVSERRQAEEALRKSKERYRKLAENFPNGTVNLYDRDLRLTFVAGDDMQKSGVLPEQVLQKTFQELCPPDTFAIAEPYLRAAFEGRSGHYETPYWGGRYYLVHVAPLENRDGSIDEIMVVCQNLTERQQAEEALRRTESLLRTVLNSVPITVFAIDPKGTFTLSQGMGLESIGLKLGQHEGTSALQIYGSLPVMEEGGKLIHGQEVIERALAGETLTAYVEMMGAYFENRVGPMRDEAGRITGVVGVAIDISERRRAEQALLESERRLQLLTELIPVKIWSARPDGASDYYNERFLQYLGKTLEEMQGWTWVDTLHPDDRERSIAAWKEAFSAGSGYEAEYRIRQASDGQYRWHLGRAIPVRDEQGNIVRWYGTDTDIDDMKRAQEQLRETKERLELLSRRQLMLQENERREIGRELHDQAGQMLTALRLTLEVASRLPPEPAAKKLAHAQDLANDLITRISALSLELRPPMLDDLGLIPALLWHVKRYEEETGTAVDFKHSGIEGRRYDPQLESTVYRIIQEALTNAARHARAKYICLTLHEENSTIQLHIEDDGQGFDPQAALARKQSNGLSGMRERASLAGGSFEIQSHTGQGTQLFIQLPVRRSEHDPDYARR